jgi:hypothetical protein
MAYVISLHNIHYGNYNDDNYVKLLLWYIERFNQVNYHHKPIVRRVEYSPLMVESDGEVTVMEERRPEEIPTTVTPSILLWRQTTIYLLLCFVSPPPSAM